MKNKILTGKKGADVILKQINSNKVSAKSRKAFSKSLENLGKSIK